MQEPAGFIFLVLYTVLFLVSADICGTFGYNAPANDVNMVRYWFDNGLFITAIGCFNSLPIDINDVNGKKWKSHMDGRNLLLSTMIK